MIEKKKILKKELLKNKPLKKEEPLDSESTMQDVLEELEENVKKYHAEKR